MLERVEKSIEAIGAHHNFTILLFNSLEKCKPDLSHHITNLKITEIRVNLGREEGARASHLCVPTLLITHKTRIVQHIIMPNKNFMRFYYLISFLTHTS